MGFQGRGFERFGFHGLRFRSFAGFGDIGLPCKVVAFGVF